MTASILVTGATGRLGRLVTSRLISSGDDVRVLTRRPEEARRLWGSAVEIATGSFEDRESLHSALEAIEKIFLLHPISANLADHQISLIDAAAEAGVRQIVKISGSDWTIVNAHRSIAGAQHQRVEAHLANTPLARAILRPNAWMQVSLVPVVAAALEGRDLPSRYAGAAVSFIDINDIADVAARVLHTGLNLNEPLVLTGAKALTASDIAGLVSGILRRPFGIDTEVPKTSPGHADPFAAQAVREFATLIAEGLAAPVTDTVERVLGRKPTSLRHFFELQLASALKRSSTAQGDIQWQ